MSDAVLSALITASAGAVMLILTKLFGKRDTAYDQIQEDLKSMREDRASDRSAAIQEREKDRVEMRNLQAIVIHLDNEVTELRRNIEAGTVPPLYPRPAWPPREKAS